MAVRADSHSVTGSIRCTNKCCEVIELLPPQMCPFDPVSPIQHPRIKKGQYYTYSVLLVVSYAKRRVYFILNVEVALRI